MQMPHLMATLSQVLDNLRLKGMDNDFKWMGNGFSIDGEKTYQPHELTIIKVYRFEELKDPSDMSVLYLLETTDGRIGYIIDAYGIYSQHDMDGFDNALRLVPQRNHDGQLLFEL